MQIIDTIPLRHSVRSFLDKPIHPAKAAQLQYVIDGCNRDFGTHIQLILDDPEVFAKKKPFQNAVNYIALVGSKKRDPQEALGYCGQMLVLKAQAIGLNTCWVAGSYRKGKVKAAIGKGEKLYAVIALGYGENPGKLHKERHAIRHISGEKERNFRCRLRNGGKLRFVLPCRCHDHGNFLFPGLG